MPSAPRHCAHALGTRVDVLTGDTLLEELRDAPQAESVHLAYVNAHSLNLAYADPRFRAALGRCTYVLNDGIGLDLNGSDFTLRLLELAAEQDWRVFLYGGRPGVAARARTELARMIEGLTIVGVEDGFTHDQREVAQVIRRARPDVVIVALGQPLQELWIDQWLPETGCHLGVGVGAFLDFASGQIPRAPTWIHRIGLEWMYRLLQEPRRLARRYLVGNPLFLWRALRLRGSERGLMTISGNLGAPGI